MADNSAFLEAWYSAMIIGGIVFTSLGLILYLTHNINVATIRDFKKKYDYINANEVKWYKWAFYMLAVGAGFFINLYGSGASNLSTVGVWFFVRVFFGIA